MAKQWSVVSVVALMVISSEVLRAEGLQTGGWDHFPNQQLVLITDLPETRPVELINIVHALRSDLEVRREVLEEKAAAMVMNPAEIVLVIAVPGGTLYAAYKVALQLDRKKKLERVTTEISELDKDLEQLAFIVGVDGVMLARADR